MSPSRTPEKRTRDVLLAGAVVVIAGLALVGTSHADVGGVVVLAGWVLLGASIHRYGRASTSI